MPEPTDGPSPGLLRTLLSAVVLDGQGDVELTRETRGATVEWGGVYGQLVRLTGPWRLKVSVDGTSLGLPASRLPGSRSGEGFRSEHATERFHIVQEIVPLPDVPGVVRSLTVSSTTSMSLPLTITGSFEPFLLPVLVEGIRPIRYRVETRPEELRVRHRGFGLSYRWSQPPARLYLNRASWRGGRYDGPVLEVASDHELFVAPGRPVELRWSIVGGLERTLERLGRAGPRLLPDPGPVSASLAASEDRWAKSTPVVRFPDAPGLERGYELARSALRQLYSAPGEGLTGLVAGYPWYSAIWGRDLAWMLPAVLWLGDFDWARRSIASMLRFQSRAEIPIVGGEPGELPMQISPGPIFLFGTSDTTLYFPGLIRRLVRHSGDSTIVVPWRSALERMIAWGVRRTDPATGLLRNGGEAAAIQAATRSLSRTHFGIDAPDTTIWDSTDRRDHAIDVQVLWYEALRSAGELFGSSGGAGATSAPSISADQVADSIRSHYVWSEEGYLFDSICEGEPVRHLRPNALRAASAGILDPTTARRLVQRAAEDDLTTPWGVRTLSSKDRTYSARAYHDGQVWPIATAWAADAAFAAGEEALGLQYLTRLGAWLGSENGMANECYLGDRAEPFDSCFLLGLSIAPFLTVVFERLWGLSVDGATPGLRVEPRFPATWRSASLENLRIADGRCSLVYEAPQLRVRWTGPRPLVVAGRAGSTQVPAGGEADVPVS